MLICISYTRSYQSIVEDYTGVGGQNGKNFTHIFVQRSDDVGATWSGGNYLGLDVTEYNQWPNFDSLSAPAYEGAFASMAKRVDANVHLLYQLDAIPGYGVYAGTGTPPDPDNTSAQSTIVYVKLRIEDLLNVGVKEEKNSNDKLLVYPNPASNSISVTLTGITKNGNAKLSVYNVLGQEIESKYVELKSFAMNTNKLDISKCNPGVYFVSVMADNKRYIQKLIIE